MINIPIYPTVAGLLTSDFLCQADWTMKLNEVEFAGFSFSQHAIGQFH